jgi:hypothetical protein
MFKHSLLTFALAGLITGSVKPEERKTSAMAEKVEKLRTVMHNSYLANVMALTASGFISMAFLTDAILHIFRDTTTYSGTKILAAEFIEPIRFNVKVAGVLGAIAVYNALVLYFGERKTRALDDIQKELEAQQA